MARHGLLGLGGLWLRLALAFLIVSLTALIVDTTLIATSLSVDIRAVAKQQEAVLAQAAAFSAGAAYQGVGWASADLNPVFDLASRAGAAVLIRDRSGRVIGSSSRYSSYPAARARTLPIVSERHRRGRVMATVGQLTVRFGPSGLGALARKFEAQRLRARVIATVVAALLALVVSVIAARLIIAPIEVMLKAMRARAGGNRGYRIPDVRAPGVLSELLLGFNAATDTFDAMDRAQRNLAKIAADVAERLGDAFAAAEVTLSTSLDPVTVQCDSDRIQDVISNLLINALKFTPAGGTVTVRTERESDQQAVVRVSDTGIGIPADELPRVTERFFRGQRSAGMASGSGIGMAIVGELVRVHHGALAISSEEGHGTQVSVTLPVTGN